MSRWGLSALILSSSLFILITEREAVMSAATMTYPLPVSANEVSILSSAAENGYYASVQWCDARRSCGKGRLSYFSTECRQSPENAVTISILSHTKHDG